MDHYLNAIASLKTENVVFISFILYMRQFMFLNIVIKSKPRKTQGNGEVNVNRPYGRMVI